MIAETLREDIESIEIDDTVARAFEILNAHEIGEVAVTDKGKFQYILREIDLIGTQNEKISKLKVDHENLFLFEDDHILQGLVKLNNHDLSIIPVVNRKMEYKGAISHRSVIDYLCDSYSLGSEGSIIILEVTFRDYTLTDIANIIEQEGCKILGLFMSPSQISKENVWISLKLNTLVIASIISALERHEYNVVAQMTGEYTENIIKERYESLMSFLNV